MLIGVQVVAVEIGVEEGRTRRCRCRDSRPLLADGDEYQYKVYS